MFGNKTHNLNHLPFKMNCQIICPDHFSEKSCNTLLEGAQVAVNIVFQIVLVFQIDLSSDLPYNLFYKLGIYPLGNIIDGCVYQVPIAPLLDVSTFAKDTEEEHVVILEKMKYGLVEGR